MVFTGIDSMELLDQAFQAADSFRPMSTEDVRDLLSRTAEHASGGDFELFKTTSLFDATAQNPAWLGDESQRVQSYMSL